MKYVCTEPECDAGPFDTMDEAMQHAKETRPERDDDAPPESGHGVCGAATGRIKVTVECHVPAGVHVDELRERIERTVRDAKCDVHVCEVVDL